MMKTAIIGAGVIGTQHARVLHRLGREVAYLCDVDRPKAERFAAKKAPEAIIYEDWRKMLDEAEIDVVHICTPHDLHAPMIIEALARDIHVLCEKPLCISRAELDAILEAEKRSSAGLGVCLQNRYLDANRFVYDYLSDKTVSAASGTVVWRRTAEYYGSAEWRGTLAREGGGVLINQALHTLDLLCWFCGDQSAVCARADNFTLDGVIEVEDTLSAVFFGDQPFTFFATNASAVDMAVQINLSLSNGEFITVMPDLVTVNGEVRYRNDGNEYFGKPCYGNGHERLMREFYACAEQGSRFPIDGAEAARVMRHIFAAYESRGEKTKI